MPNPSEVFNELVSTTFRNHRKEAVDTVSGHNALYRMLGKGGRVRTESGGTSIAIPLEYAENATYQRYSGLDLLNIQQSDVVTSAEFAWRQIAIHVAASGYELRVNAGAEKIASLAKVRMRNAMNTFANNFSADMYSDGTLVNQIDGLQRLVPDSGQGTVGGINSATWDFWRTKVQSAAAPISGGAAVTVNAANIEGLMLGLYMETTRGNDHTDLIVASNDLYQMFETSQLSLKRYAAEDEVMAGFLSLRYKNAKVVHDGNSGMPNTRMYFLNTKHFEMVAHTDANLTPVESQRPTQQDGSITPILWMGNQVCSNRSLQGILRP